MMLRLDRPTCEVLRCIDLRRSFTPAINEHSQERASDRLRGIVVVWITEILSLGHKEAREVQRNLNHRRHAHIWLLIGI